MVCSQNRHLSAGSRFSGSSNREDRVENIGISGADPVDHSASGYVTPKPQIAADGLPTAGTCEISQPVAGSRHGTLHPAVRQKGSARRSRYAEPVSGGQNRQNDRAADQQPEVGVLPSWIFFPHCTFYFAWADFEPNCYFVGHLRRIFRSAAVGVSVEGHRRRVPLRLAWYST